MRMLAVLVFLGCLGIGLSAQNFAPENNKSTAKGGARMNIEFYLAKVGLLDKLEIFSEKSDRVFARDISGGELLKILETDPNWVEVKKRKFLNFYGHKGATRSWRYARSPSLQITQIVNKMGGYIYETDIDKWRGFWKHLTREVAPHFFRGRLKLFFLPKHTNQEDIAELLNSEW